MPGKEDAKIAKEKNSAINKNENKGEGRAADRA
jgi:hypothetical protein